MIIREAIKKDCVQLFNLWNFLREYHYNYLKSKQVNQENKNFYYSLVESQNCFIIVAEEENIIIGYVECYLKDIEEKKSCYILHAYIEETARKTTAAIKMFLEIKEKLKKLKVEYLYADVFYENTAFYNAIGALGFKIHKTTFLCKVDGD